MIKNEEIEKLKEEILLKPLNSPEELRDWVWLYFDLYMPMGHISDNANSSAVESMWEVYNAVKSNTGDSIPGYTLLSARDCYKTISSSIVEVLLLIHFKLTIAHTAAQKNQAFKAIEYHNSFLNKIMPYLEAKGWKRTTQNTMRIELQTDKKEVCYIQVIVLTMKGSNSAHTNFLTIDEADLCEIKPYQEAKMIPGVLRGRFPITLRLSTRKFNFGIMQMEIDRAPITNEKVLQWNILDVTQYCPPERCEPDKEKIIRYIPKELPLRQLTQSDFDLLDATKQSEFEKIEAFSGCAKCDLLSVCKTRLHTKKTPDMTGDLWKPIPATINVIKAVNPDVGEAQLLCNKPSTAGLIYPRFEIIKNVKNVPEAWEMITGDNRNVRFEELIDFIKKLGVPIHCGIDWGFTHQFAAVVGARLGNGICLILDKFTAPGLELSDCVRIGKDLKDKYGIEKFWCDNAYPAYIKTYNKNGLMAPHFDKDVARGITSVRDKIVDGGGQRKFFILDTENNQTLIKAMGSYHWKLDLQGNPTDKPDHTEEADEMDALRYLVENMFSFSGKISFATVESDPNLIRQRHTRNQSLEEAAKQTNQILMKDKINELVPETNRQPEKKKGVKKVLWM